MARSRKKERRLFVTSDPSFRHPEWAVGELVVHEREVFRVTRWVERDPVRLRRGGSVRQWEIWGEPVSDEDVREELARAAERMLSEG
jgi:hypothetical protein